MNDTVNITGRKYETQLLKNQTCIQCREDFIYDLHPNKRVFKKTEYSFYLMKPEEEVGKMAPYYLHAYCLIELLKSNQYRKKKLSINGLQMSNISFMNRFGRPINKTNYAGRLDTILRGYYEKKCRKLFVKKVRPLYTVESEFPRYCQVTFNGDKKKFERIRKRLQKHYRKKKGISLELPTIEEVRCLLEK